MTEPILDEPHPLYHATLPRVRLMVEYREVGAGPQSVEIEWEGVAPDASALAYVARVLAQARDGDLR